MYKNRAVFLDRDGTIVQAYGNRPANTPEEMVLLPQAAAGIKLLKENGFLLVVVSNQGGIGAGHTTTQQVHEMHSRLDDLLIVAGSPKIDAYYFCPHKIDEGCYCRKPRAGMLVAAAEDLDINLISSHIIGDDQRDMEAGIAAGVDLRYLVWSDRSTNTARAHFIFKDLLEAATAVAAIEEGRRKRTPA